MLCFDLFLYFMSGFDIWIRMVSKLATYYMHAYIWWHATNYLLSSYGVKNNVNIVDKTTT